MKSIGEYVVCREPQFDLELGQPTQSISSREPRLAVPALTPATPIATLTRTALIEIIGSASPCAGEGKGTNRPNPTPTPRHLRSEES